MNFQRVLNKMVLLIIEFGAVLYTFLETVYARDFITTGDAVCKEKVA
jgi:hypothetical protein